MVAHTVLDRNLVRAGETVSMKHFVRQQTLQGLALGCLIANILGSATVWDIVFGTLATLLAAVLTRRLRKNVWLAAAMPVVCNAVIIGLVLHFTLADVLLWPTMASVGLGEAAVVYLLGVPMIYALRRVPALQAQQHPNAEISDTLKKTDPPCVKSMEENR